MRVATILADLRRWGVDPDLASMEASIRAGRPVYWLILEPVGDAVIALLDDDIHAGTVANEDAPIALVSKG